MDYQFDLRNKNLHNKSELFEDFLNEACSSEESIITLINILKEENDDKFTKYCKSLNMKCINRDDLLFWLSYKDYFGNISHQFCVSTFDDIIEKLESEERIEDIAKLIDGDEDTFNKIKSENETIRNDQTATFDWFYSNYIEEYYALRYIFKKSGIVFIDYEEGL